MDTYNKALNFWNQAFELNDEERNELLKEINTENGWKEIASSEKLRDVIEENLAGCSKVLDYGCGEGWAGIILSKSGCRDVTCVDVVENAIEMVKIMSAAYKVGEGFKAECVSTEWLGTVEEEAFDGIFCGNVIDVLPADVSKEIVKNLSRIASKDGKVIIAMNYYKKLESDPEKNREVKNGNEVYLDDVLRLVLRTDEEWAELFSEFFTIEKIDHFAWTGENEETRRLFILKKK